MDAKQQRDIGLNMHEKERYTKYLQDELKRVNPFGDNTILNMDMPKGLIERASELSCQPEEIINLIASDFIMNNSNDPIIYDRIKDKKIIDDRNRQLNELEKVYKLHFTENSWNKNCWDILNYQADFYNVILRYAKYWEYNELDSCCVIPSEAAKEIYEALRIFCCDIKEG